MFLFWSKCPDHFRIKIGRIMYLTYFGTTVSDKHFEKIPEKTVLWIKIKLMSRGRFNNV